MGASAEFAAAVASEVESVAVTADKKAVIQVCTDGYSKDAADAVKLAKRLNSEA